MNATIDTLSRIHDELSGVSVVEAHDRSTEDLTAALRLIQRVIDRERRIADLTGDDQ